MQKASGRATPLALLFLAAAAIVAAGCGGGKKTTTAKTATTKSAAKKTGTKSYILKARLSTAQEAPKAKDAASGAGSFTATITLKGRTGTLASHLVFEHLSGPATAAHVHLGPPGTAGPIAIPLCAPCKPSSHGSFTGPIGGNARLLHALLGGATYSKRPHEAQPGGRDPRTDQSDADVQQRRRDDYRRHDDILRLLAKPDPPRSGDSSSLGRRRSV